MGSASDEAAVSAGPGSDETIVASGAGRTLDGDRLRRLEHGARVGRYTVLGLIGAGGMGVVYEAYDPELDRRVALKLLSGRAGGTAGSQVRGALLGEAKTLARLSHPNVVAVYDAGRVTEGPAADSVFLAMELIEGRTLREWVADQRELDATDWRAILEVFVAAAQGLAAAHMAGVVHRDFKPQNVLVSGSGRRRRVLVADFGLAVMETDGEACTDSVAGTPAYMAPEQIAGMEVGPPADQFAFCVALFEALHGAHPFRRDTVMELADAVLHAAPNAPPRGTSVPTWLRRAIAQGLARTPSKRHPSMEALVGILARDRMQRVRRGVVVAAGLTILGGAVYAIAALLQPGHVTVTVVDKNGGTVPDATVAVGEHMLARSEAGLAGKVESGTFTLRVSAPAYETQTSALEVVRGGKHAVTVALAHQTGVVNLAVEPRGATVLVDGVDRGSRLTNLVLDTGLHDVVVQKTGHYVRKQQIEVRHGEAFNGFISLPEAQAYRSRATGPSHELQWAGDATGDRRPEVYARTFNTLELHDPWEGRVLWSHTTADLQEVRYRFGDVDGDGAQDAVRAIGGGSETTQGLAVFVAVQDDREITPLWDKQWTRREDAVFRSTGFCVTDVDDDGRADVVNAQLGEGAVVARSGLTGDTLWRYPIDVPALAVEPVGKNRIVVVTAEGVLGLTRGGQREWWQPFGDVLSGEVPIMDSQRTTLGGALVQTHLDLSRDGEPDVVVPIRTKESGPVALWAIDGTTGERLWQAPAAGPFGSYAFPHSDLDGDGVAELLVAVGTTQPRRAAVIDGATGVVSATMPGRNAVFLDGYQPPRILTLSKDGVRTFDSAGTLIGTSDLPPRATYDLATFDHDGDGVPEAVFADRSPGLHIFDGEAKSVGFVPAGATLSRLVSEGDVDHDGFPDLLARSDGVMLVHAERTRWRREAREGLRVSPVVFAPPEGKSLTVGVFGNFTDKHALNLFDALTGQRLATGEAHEVIRTPGVTTIEGQPAVISQGLGRYLAINDGATGTLLRKLSVPQSYAAPAVGDANADGRPDAFVMPWNPGPAQLVDLQTATPIWSYDSEAGAWATPGILERADRAPALLVGLTNGDLELRDGRDGTLAWRTALGAMKHSFPPAVATRGTKTLLLVGVPDAADAMVALDARNGEELWRASGPSHRTGPVAADVDGDGEAEIFAGTKTGVMSLALDGTERWHHQTSTSTFRAYVSAEGQLVVADVDHDGRLELIAGFSDGSARVLDAETGTLRVSIRGSGDRIEGGPISADVDGDGMDELLLAGRDRWLRCVNLPRAAFGRDALAGRQGGQGEQAED